MAEGCAFAEAAKHLLGGGSTQLMKTGELALPKINTREAAELRRISTDGSSPRPSLVLLRMWERGPKAGRPQGA